MIEHIVRQFMADHICQLIIALGELQHSDRDINLFTVGHRIKPLIVSQLDRVITTGFFRINHSALGPGCRLQAVRDPRQAAHPLLAYLRSQSRLNNLLSLRSLSPSFLILQRRRAASQKNQIVTPSRSR